MPTNAYLQDLLQLDKLSSQFPDSLCDVLSRRDFDEDASNLQTDDDLVEVIEYLDRVLNDLDPASPAFRQTLRKLQGICSSRTFLPSSHALPVDLLNIDKSPFASGGFSDVFQGTYGGLKVCVKRLRVAATSSPERVTKGITPHDIMLCREAVMWKRLIHENVVPFMGVTFDPLQIVSEWMSGGDLTTHIRSNPQADRITLLIDVAEGLNYLHQCDVIHGDLKGLNIMVDAHGRARITDFGLARNRLAAEETYATAGGTARWTAPEILKEQGTLSKGADVFSFAMVMVEVFTGSAPFDLHPSIAATVAIMRGERPPRPTHPAFTHELWALMQRCWSQEPHLRPDMPEVLRALRCHDPSQLSMHGTSSASTLTVNQQPPVDSIHLHQGTSTSHSPPCLKTIPGPPCSKSNDVNGAELLKGYVDVGLEISAAPSPDRILDRLRSLDRSSSGFHDQVCTVLYEEEYRKCIPDLQGDESAWLVEYLDEVLDGIDPSGPVFRKCLRELRKICGTRGILPTSYTLSSDLLAIGSDPFALGGYGDVYEGTLDGSRVCIKRIRVYVRDGLENAAKIFCREAVMWKHLTHPNLVHILGVTLDPFQFVSDWMSGGDLPGYISRNPGVDRLELLSEVTMGFCYLHSRNIVHGDLKGSNILVDATGRARITDFGQTMFAQSLDTMQSASRHGNTTRWAAPEVLGGQPPTKETDIFSFAMVMIEVYTGAVPFSTRSTPMSIFATMQGDRPPRPTHPTFTDRLWELVQRCWDQEPHLRPEAPEVLQVLLTMHPSWKRLISYTLAKDQRIPLITKIFSDPNEVKMIMQLSGDDAQALIDMIPWALDSLAPDIHRECLHYLYRICGHRTLLPRSLIIQLDCNITGDPLYSGRFAEVWKGQYRGQDVAAKVLKLQSKGDMGRLRRRFCSDVIIWNALRHENVLPLLGVTMTDDQLIMVSEWMANGNIVEFVKVHTSVDRLGLLGDVTRGLIYMHNRGMIHGGLRGANILINHSGHACLAGFGQLTIALDQSTTTPLAVTDDAIRWMSPELINPQTVDSIGRPTKESDCYALGMAIYEVLSERVPFAPSGGTAIISKVVGGERPERPQGREGAWFTDGLWRMLEDCWKPQPDDRPTLDIVLECLQGGRKLSARSRRGWVDKLLHKTFKFSTGKSHRT